MRNLYIIALALLLCSMLSCKPASKQIELAQTEVEIMQQSLQFTLPEIPTFLTDPAGRADYLVRHYWDNVNFADTLYNKEEELLEQAWVDYCDLLSYVPLSTAHESMTVAMTNLTVNKEVFLVMAELADKYLYDPNSPMRNEEFYIPVLEVMTQTPVLTDDEKIRPSARLQLAQSNRVGSKALDFVYTTRNGKQSTLYKTKGDYLLLFINNPGCDACGQYLRQLSTAPIIDRMVKDGDLTPLAFYPDEQLDEWYKHEEDFPDYWINSYDKEQVMHKQNLYDLKAIPTLYLLDKNKVVLLKDATPSSIEEYLLINS